MITALIDWGTSSLRVYSFDYNTSPVLLLEDAKAGVLSVSSGGFEKALEDALQRCGENIFTSKSPVLMCGMVGSNRGWQEVKYVSCPATASSISEGCFCFNSSLSGRSITIVPGVCTLSNLNKQPDVMRGEETQVIGELLETRDIDVQDDEVRVYCLPGTHSKWVISRGKRIESLQTAMTGEIFSILSRHSILAGSIAAEDDDKINTVSTFDKDEDAGFIEGLSTVAPLHALFSVRTRDLFSGGGEARMRACATNRGFLSGTLIGLELREAFAWLSSLLPLDSLSHLQVSIIGAGPLAERYAKAIKHLGLAQPIVAAPHAAARGLIIVGRMLGTIPPPLPPSSTTTSITDSTIASSIPTSVSSSPLLTTFHLNVKKMHQQRFAQLTKCLAVCPIIAILRGLDPNNAAEIGLSLYKAGVRVIEVPLNSPVRPLDSIRNLLSAFLHLPKDERPVIGAGTVLSVDDVMNVVAAGGQVALSPNSDTDVIQAARVAGLPFFPGVFTATEALLALKAGASGLKLFPCTAISISTVEALKAILPRGTPLLAVGGVGASNGVSYLSAGCIGLGVGSAIFETGLSTIEVGNKAVKLIKALSLLNSNT